MATKADFDAAIADLGTSVDGVKADIQALKDQIAAGGMTVAEEDAAKAALQEKIDALKALDAENP